MPVKMRSEKRADAPHKCGITSPDIGVCALREFLPSSTACFCSAVRKIRPPSYASLLYIIPRCEASDLSSVPVVLYREVKQVPKSILEREVILSRKVVACVHLAPL